MNSYSYDELQNAFKELVEEFEKSVLKNKAFKKESLISFKRIK
jgi:hypothetical protein